MNERIKLLAEQSGCDWWEGQAQRDMTRCQDELEKFAELIVRECLMKATGAMIRKESIKELIVNIAEDFGVEI